MQIKHLQGLIAAPFTPMHPDGSLHLELIPAYYTLLKANGNTGAFICGSTGEGVSLTIEEKKRVAEAWAAAIIDDKDFNIITLVGGTCLQDAVELAQHAHRIGLFAVAFTGPSYFKPANVQVLADCCAEVAEAVPEMPFYYYHIPVLTGVNFNMIDLLKEVEDRIHNFVGIKYTHEDFMDFMSCLHFKCSKYDMLWGRDENLLSALVLGAKGGVGSTYNYAAPLYSNLINAYNRGDMEEARSLQQKSIDMIGLLGKYGGIATGKAFMKLVGLDCGEFRLPVRNMSPEQFRLFKEDVVALGFAEYCSRAPETKYA
ncbi:N-acetylneuraminate lyase [Pontibacter ummariensis]|uniref:N-acetylneuraminate lyase n=1 Tax=Pontibacter ummariensis TaxID=1610492 RepID=A0A239L6B0_9BACT|nr:dihydrodipicolinate synthase family protein [Pontibacter ummariensis]PRY04307.1 N-acetylneuraminate lyase [Pontibacter ummariensis]SNT25064.1 N-acetylneuraminate lyase [Pontibacter ummariensis]